MERNSLNHLLKSIKQHLLATQNLVKDPADPVKNSHLNNSSFKTTSSIVRSSRVKINGNYLLKDTDQYRFIQSKISLMLTSTEALLKSEQLTKDYLELKNGLADVVECLNKLKANQSMYSSTDSQMIDSIHKKISLIQTIVIEINALLNSQETLSIIKLATQNIDNLFQSYQDKVQTASSYTSIKTSDLTNILQNNKFIKQQTQLLKKNVKEKSNKLVEPKNQKKEITLYSQESQTQKEKIVHQINKDSQVQVNQWFQEKLQLEFQLKICTKNIQKLSQEKQEILAEITQIFTNVDFKNVFLNKVSSDKYSRNDQSTQTLQIKGQQINKQLQSAIEHFNKKRTAILTKLSDFIEDSSKQKSAIKQKQQCKVRDLSPSFVEVITLMQVFMQNVNKLFNQKISLSSKELRIKTDNLKQLKQYVQNEQQKLNSIKIDVEKFSTIIREKQGQIKSLNMIEEQIKKAFIQSINSNFKQEIGSNRTKTTKYQSNNEVQNLKITISRMNKQADQNKTKFDQLKRQNEKLYDEIHKLKKNMLEFNPLKMTESFSQAQSFNKENQIKSLKNQISELSLQLRNFTKQFDSRGLAIKNIKTQNILDSQWQQKDKLEEKMQQLNKNLKDQLTEVNANCRKLQTQSKSLQTNLENSRTKLIAAQKQNIQLVQQLKQKQNELKRTKLQLQSKKEEPQKKQKFTNNLNSYDFNIKKQTSAIYINQRVQLEENKGEAIEKLHQKNQGLEFQKDKKINQLTANLSSANHQIQIIKNQLKKSNQFISKVIDAFSQKINRKVSQQQLLSLIISYQPPVGMKLIYSSIFLGQDTQRSQTLQLCEQFAAKRIKKTERLGRFPDTTSIIHQTPKQSNNFPFMMLYKTTKGTVFGSFSLKMREPTFFFRFGTDFKSEVKQWIPNDINPKYTSVDFVQSKYIQYGSGELRINCVDLKTISANSDIKGYFNFDWRTITNQNDEAKIILSEVELHRVEFIE